MNRFVANRFNSLTFWYPILKDIAEDLANPIGKVTLQNGKLVAHEPVPSKFLLRLPDTSIVFYPHGRELFRMFDGEPVKGWVDLVESVDRAVAGVGGYPVFIRSESSSDKHDWEKSCYLESKEQIGNRIGALAEHCSMADWDCSFFVVRKLIPTTPVATAFYGNMPIAVERRLFIEGGKVVCNHPYWPNEALEGEASVSPEQITQLQADQDFTEIEQAAAYVSERIGGSWSIDFLQASNGDWYCIDMALAEISYHWPDCPNLEGKA